MARMSLETAIRLSAEVKGGGNITKVQREIQSLSASSKLSARELGTMRVAALQLARANDGTVAGIRSSIAALRGLKDQAKIGGQEFRALGADIQKLEAKLRGIDGTAEKAGRSLGQNLAAGLAAGLAAAGIGQAVRGSLEAVVASEESQRRLRSLSQGLDDYSRVQATATAAAQKFGVAQTQANQEFAQIYARLRPVGLTLEEISSVYNGFNTAAKLSGTTSAEASAAFLQLSQALGTGVLRGEELNSVFEQTPAVVQGIAQVMGVPIGQIRELAKEGKISSDIVLEALKRIERDGAPKLAEAMKGPAQQFKNLQIAGQDLQIQLGQALLPTALALANAALALAQGFNSLPGPVKNTAIAVGIATTAALGLVAAVAALKAGLAVLGGATAIKAAITGVLTFGGAATTATGAITGLKAAMLAIPGVGWAAAAIVGTGLLGKAVYDTNETFRNFVDNIGGVLAADFRTAVNGMATDAKAAAGGIDKAYKDLAKGMEPVADFIRQLFKDAFKDTSDSARVSATQSSNAFSDFFTSLSTSATAGFSGLNTIISNWWNSLPEPIRNIFGGNAASMLAGAAQYAGGAINRSTQTGPQRLKAAGSTATYTVGGITYETATGAPVKAPPAFVPAAPVPGNAMNTPIGATVGGGGVAGGGGKAATDLAKAQAAAAKKMQQQLKAADATNTALKDQLAILQTTEPVARQMLEYDIQQNQLAREYQELKDAAVGPDELILINANLIIEQRIAQIEHEEKINSLLVDRAILMANVAAQAGMPTVYSELETQEAALQAVLDKYPAIGAAADAASTLATSGISEMIAGTKDAKEVFADFLKSIADALMDTAKQMIAQYIAIGIARIFAGIDSSVGTDAVGWNTSLPDFSAGVGTGFNFDADAMTGGMPWSFAGGGYTGNAPRAGGVDGQGGFPAILHPRETVIDHTKAAPAMAVPYQRSGPAMAVPFQKAAGGATGDSMNATIDVKFETVRIGAVDYVTRDEAEQIGRESAQKGADLAHKRYRNNPSSRREAGFS